MSAVATLRGAGVDVDVRRAGRVLVGAVLGALAVLAVVLFVAGAQKNAQITSLRSHGVPVTVTVTGCTGLLGGSGSNAAGYACRGTFSVAGHRYDEAIPGDTLYPPGTPLAAVTVPGDPGSSPRPAPSRPSTPRGRYSSSPRSCSSSSGRSSER